MKNGIRLVRTWSPVVLAAVARIPVAIACGGDDKQAVSPQNNSAVAGNGPPGYPGQPPPGSPTTNPNPGYPPAGGTAYPPGTAPPGTAPPGATATASASAGTPQDQLNQLLQGIASAVPGVFTNPGGLGADPAEAGLRAQAARLAANMQPEGQMLKQQFTDGQHVEMMVPMQAGKCYTILGFSPPGGVKDLDPNLMAPPFYNTVFMSDTTKTNSAALAGAPNPTCPVLPIPVQYKLDVHARGGAGMVVVQVYSRNK